MRIGLLEVTLVEGYAFSILFPEKMRIAKQYRCLLELRLAELFSLKIPSEKEIEAFI